MKKYKRFFIVLGIIAAAVLAISAFWCWVKRSLSFVIDNLDDIFEDEESIAPKFLRFEDEDDDDSYEGIGC